MTGARDRQEPRWVERIIHGTQRAPSAASRSDVARDAQDSREMIVSAALDLTRQRSAAWGGSASPAGSAAAPAQSPSPAAATGPWAHKAAGKAGRVEERRCDAGDEHACAQLAREARARSAQLVQGWLDGHGGSPSRGGGDEQRRQQRLARATRLCAAGVQAACARASELQLLAPLAARRAYRARPATAAAVDVEL